MAYKSELEKDWTEKVFPHLKKAIDESKALKLEFNWDFIIGDERFFFKLGKNNEESGRAPVQQTTKPMPEICPACNGAGRVKATDHGMVPCLKCNLTGKLSA